jgi:anti-sigma factor RsiW
MNCEETLSNLDSFLNGRLHGEQSRQLRRHLATCAHCAAALTPGDRIEVLPAIDGEIKPSEDLTSRFHARLEAHRAAASVTIGFSLAALLRTWFPTLPRRIAGVGALAAFLITGIYLGLYHVSAPGPVPGSGEVVIAENLPLLQDMGVIKNLDLLEDLDTIQEMPGDQVPQSGTR